MRKYVMPLLLCLCHSSLAAEVPTDMGACLARKAGKMTQMVCFPDLGWTITRASLRGPKIDVPGQGSVEANHGLFVLLEMEVQVLGDQAVKAVPPPRLLDQDEKEYAPVWNARADRVLSRGGFKNIGKVGKLAPGQVVTAYALYDVDSQSSGLHLRIPAQDGKGSKVVSLELTL